MRRIWALYAWLFFLVFPFSVHAQGSSLLLYPSTQQISVGKEFSVEIVGNDLSNIAGGDIAVVYEKDKLKLLSKQILLPQEEILDLQKENENIQEMQDEEGQCKFLFALRKNAKLLGGEEKAIGTIRFRALKEGEAFVGLSEKSRWILEEEAEADNPQGGLLFPGENGLTYRYESPQLPPKALSVVIVKEEEPKEEEKEEEPNREEDSGENEHSDEEGTGGEEGRKAGRKGSRGESFSPAPPVQDAVFPQHAPYQPDGLLHLFWRWHRSISPELLKYLLFSIFAGV